MNKPKEVKLSYEDRELVLGALETYERYLRVGKVICTYGKSPVTAKRVKRLDKRVRKIHFGK